MEYRSIFQDTNSYASIMDKMPTHHAYYYAGIFDTGLSPSLNLLRDRRGSTLNSRSLASLHVCLTKNLFKSIRYSIRNLLILILWLIAQITQ